MTVGRLEGQVAIVTGAASGIGRGDSRLGGPLFLIFVQLPLEPLDVRGDVDQKGG